PTSSTNPDPISPTTAPSTVTRASVTRWIRIRTTFLSKIRSTRPGDPRFALSAIVPGASQSGFVESRRHGGHRDRGDALLAANEPHPLVGRCLDTDRRRWQADARPDGRAHRLQVRVDLRSFGDHRHIDMDRLHVELGQELNRPPDDLSAVEILPFGIGRWEMSTDIPERGSTKQRVRDGMQHHIRVRVSQQSATVRDLDATEDAGSPLGELMHVVPDT